MLKRLFSTKKARKLTKCDVSDRRSQVSQMLTHQLTCVQHDKTAVNSQLELGSKKAIFLRQCIFCLKKIAFRFLFLVFLAHP
jgi:hypothetical protein